ncbi:hypothetical protein GS429_15395 [Natronorubrum sp. JWXQ-INN-674]|uniref:Uncharacterized protein n=1 Tax=Natronorubrum halalkaliphilum TaxID=2691917 RepID=A0A6B0VP52_9EURY|nr:hypothetical protein [Natronorubrum halalkaliphilum]MXV63420.1 hypothetical protein [Natronorubrum halalkaliphilum]
MSNNNPNPKTRRNFVRTATAGLFTTTALMTSAQANKAETTDSGEVKIEDGEIVYRGPKKSVSPDQAAESAADVSHSDLDGYMQTGVEGLNEAKSNGYVEFEEKDGVPRVVPTQKGLDEHGPSQQIGILCGKNDYEAETTWRGGVRHAFYFDDSLSRNIAAAMASGAAAGVIGSKIAAATGVGAPASVVSAVAAILAGLGATLMFEANEGCGVRIRHYPAAPPVPGVGITFKPQ